MQMERVAEYLGAENIEMSFTGDLVSWLAKRGYDQQFGARPVKRIIQKMVVNELSKQIISGKVTKNSRIIADVKDDVVVFRNA